ncbi:MAG: DsbA family protein [Oscillospiraceae bacterium]|nr:DsbA family protein [Oscillospiraceae bacterium]
MSNRLKIASDFVCPYCYVLEDMLDKLRPEFDLEIEYLPFELTEPPKPQVDTYNDPERRTRYAKELQPLCEKLGLKMCLPPNVTPRPYTRLAFQGLFSARAQGFEDAYCRRIFRAYFEEERDIGSIEELVSLAAEAGLDPDGFRQALESGQWAAEEQEAVRHAKQDLNIHVVPTMFLNGHRLEGGAQSVEELRDWLKSHS